MKAVWLTVALMMCAAAAQAAALALEVHDAPDGGLRLRGVEVVRQGDTQVVSGRVVRAVALRSAAGRSVVVSLRAADGSLRASRAGAVTTLGLPRYGAAWSRFELRVPLDVAPDDVISVSIAGPRPSP